MIGNSLYEKKINLISSLINEREVCIKFLIKINYISFQDFKFDILNKFFEKNDINIFEFNIDLFLKENSINTINQKIINLINQDNNKKNLIFLYEFPKKFHNFDYFLKSLYENLSDSNSQYIVFIIFNELKKNLPKFIKNLFFFINFDDLSESNFKKNIENIKDLSLEKEKVFLSFLKNYKKNIKIKANYLEKFLYFEKLLYNNEEFRLSENNIIEFIKILNL
jgi:hypothetical protein